LCGNAKNTLDSSSSSFCAGNRTNASSSSPSFFFSLSCCCQISRTLHHWIGHLSHILCDILCRAYYSFVSSVLHCTTHRRHGYYINDGNVPSTSDRSTSFSEEDIFMLDLASNIDQRPWWRVAFAADVQFFPHWQMHPSLCFFLTWTRLPYHGLLLSSLYFLPWRDHRPFFGSNPLLFALPALSSASQALACHGGHADCGWVGHTPSLV
jgi:hypothetical protein